MKDDSFDCTLIAHLRIFLLFYRLLYCLILPENRLFFGIWKVVEIECNEGNLEWLEKKEVFNLKVWEGDKIFFWLMQHDAPFFSLRLEYVGDELVSYALNGVYHRKSHEGQNMYQEFLETYKII